MVLVGLPLDNPIGANVGPLVFALVGIGGALLFHTMALRTRLQWLYEQPQWLLSALDRRDVQPRSLKNEPDRPK
jgi:hypothetical protein